MDLQILLGNGTAPNVNGFMSELADPTDPTVVIDFSNSIGTVAAKVDGKYASMMSELKALVGPATYQKMASLFQAGSGESSESYLTRKLGGFKTNSNMPVKTAAHIQKALVYQSGRGVNSAFAPVWAGGPTVIRDEISEASKGRIALTIVTLWGFKIVREDPYSIVEYKLQ